MTDILCPVCGEPNPPEAESCKSCKAPLKTSAFSPDFAEKSDLPDWLRELSATQDDFPADSSAESGAEFPDWLSEVGEEAGLLPPAEGDEALSPEEPDWLASALAEQPPQPAAPEEQDWAAGWLAEVQAGAQPAAGEPAEEVPAVPFDEGESFEPSQAEPAGEEEVLFTLPDWVAGVAGDQPEAGAAEDQAELSPGELPGWLEAIRPTEAEMPSTPAEDVSGAVVESSGPLSGLRGVLSGEPVNIKAHRPAAYSLKLRVTDEQRQRVALLEQLLAEEPKPKALPAPPVITAQYIFRLLIALVLLLPVAYTVVKAERLTPLPERATMPGVLALYQLIEPLPDGAPVLVAFDYEAGYSGEMDAAASAVLAHLAHRDAYLTLVSTSATGPALAERFMASLGQHSSRLDMPFTNYSNLGYIPGGSIGLFSLATSLRQTLPYDLQGVDIWSREPLSAVDELTDFSLVLVLVSDPETARAWVEQVGTALQTEGTPLAVVASAQAAPMVQPYFTGTPQRVQGRVTGMAGGAAYENTTMESGPARQVWDSYSVGLMASVFVILAGVAVALAVQAFGVEKKD